MDVNNETRDRPIFTRPDPEGDAKRRSFLDAVDDCDDLPLTDWEVAFIESTFRAKHFSTRQRRCIDRMIREHGHRIDY